MGKNKGGGNMPPEPAPHPPSCTCGPWTFVNGHWTFVITPGCPVHTDG
jgi:hypothetical protein